MPAYNKMPQVIAEICKNLVTGHQANELAKRDFIKAEIKKTLAAKGIMPDQAEFEAELTKLVDRRVTPHGIPRSMDESFSHELRYGDLAEHNVDTAIEAYMEARAALKLCGEYKEAIKEKILTATPAPKDIKISHIEDIDELPGLLLLKIKRYKMSLNAAIKTYYLYFNKAELQLEYSQTQTPELMTIEDLSRLHQSFVDKIKKDYVDKFKEEIREEMKRKEMTAIPEVYKDLRYIYYKDDCFPLYCANWIRGSNFIAMSGAKSHGDVARSMHSLLFAESMQDKPPVTTIIALGNCLPDPDPYILRTDFVNSYFDDRDPASNDMSSGKSLTVSTLDDRNPAKKTENHAAELKYQINIKNTHVSPLYAASAGFISSELDVDGKKLKALLIGLPDGDSLDLEINTPETEDLKELFWQISQKSKTKSVAVHCAAGVGRTGHVILMLEILKNYQRIYASDNPEIIAKEIQAIVDRMREGRPALVYALEQHLTAVKNADIIYQYALKKKYITEPAVSSMGFLTPTPVVQEKKQNEVAEDKPCLSL